MRGKILTPSYRANCAPTRPMQRRNSGNRIRNRQINGDNSSGKSDRRYICDFVCREKLSLSRLMGDSIQNQFATKCAIAI